MTARQRRAHTSAPRRYAGRFRAYLLCARNWLHFTLPSTFSSSSSYYLLLLFLLLAFSKARAFVTRSYAIAATPRHCSARILMLIYDEELQICRALQARSATLRLRAYAEGTVNQSKLEVPLREVAR